MAAAASAPCLLLVVLCCAAAAQLRVAAQPADSEGVSFSTVPELVQWGNNSCGDPATTTKCTGLKEKLCGKRDTSEVLCLNNSNSGQPEALFRRTSRYTRVTYLRCSLSRLACSTHPETYTGAARFVDPLDLAACVQYVSKCSPAAASDSAAPAAECTKLSSALCSRPDVACSKDATEFKDSSKKGGAEGRQHQGPGLPQVNSTQCWRQPWQLLGLQPLLPLVTPGLLRWACTHM